MLTDKHSNCYLFYVGKKGKKNLFLLLCIIDEKEYQIFLIYKEIPMGLIAKSYMN